MPEPKKGESKNEYIGRCVSYVMNEDPNIKQDHALAKCYGMWEQAHKNEEVTMGIAKTVNKYLKESVSTTDIENWFRDTLSGTSRKTDADEMWNRCKKEFRGIDRDDFDEVWDSLIDDGYLVKAGGRDYKWEM